MSNVYRIEARNGHYELLVNGVLYSTADTFEEAVNDLEELKIGIEEA